MNVKKIFIVLITIVACVMLGALILNVLFPNVASTLVNGAEDMLFKATGMSFDFNNDGNVGDNGGGTYAGDQTADHNEGADGNAVEGFD